MKIQLAPDVALLLLHTGSTVTYYQLQIYKNSEACLSACQMNLDGAARRPRGRRRPQAASLCKNSLYKGSRDRWRQRKDVIHRCIVPHKFATIVDDEIDGRLDSIDA